MKKTTKILALASLAMAFVLSGCMGMMSPTQVADKCDQTVDKSKLAEKDLSGNWEISYNASSKADGHESTGSSKLAVTLTKVEGTTYKVSEKKGGAFSSESKDYLTSEEKSFYTDDKIKELVEKTKTELEKYYDNVKVSIKVDKDGYLVEKESGKSKGDKSVGVYDLAIGFTTNSNMTAFASKQSYDFAGDSSTYIITLVKK